ncbi:MAG TPA: DedA family protein [Candidatus Saccharimonadales bacterium]|nr:DedA family protein [Candidatus Saccharimonadales bacterium]
MDVTHLLESVGVIGGLLAIAGIIFAEAGLLIGFFLPGDTLLFPAGFFAAQGKLPLAGVLIAAFVGSVIGNEVGYIIGKKSGPRVFRKEDGIIFRREYITKAGEFYEKHGGKTIIFARFIPILRTFAPLVAGVGGMNRRKFFLYNIIGAIGWVGSTVLLGYWLGSKIPNIDHYILPAIGVATLFTFGPTLLHLLREPRLRAWIGDQWQRVMMRLQRRSK